MQKLAATFSLFASFGTLFCCALPALLVTIGAGVALAGLVANIPELVWYSEHKDYFFAGSAIIIVLAGFSMWKARNAPCPADPKQADACTRLRKRSKIIYFISLGIYLTGFFFAYIAQYLI